MSVDGNAFPDFDYLTPGPHERGESFHLSPETYRRLASAALRFPGHPPMFLRALEGQRGCALDLFGEAFQFTITVRPELGISLSVAALDDSYSASVIFSGHDTPSDWRRMLMLARNPLP